MRPTKHSIIILGAAFVAFGLKIFGLTFMAYATPQATQKNGEPIDTVVLCHDTDRNIVQSVLRGQCEGRIVSENEAEQIRLEEKRKRALRLSNGKNSKSVQKPRRGKAQRFGTAFSIDVKGHFLTARHVVDACESLSLFSADGKGYEAVISKLDDRLDMALLFAPGTSARPLFFAQDEPHVNEAVFALGYPEEGLPRIRPSQQSGPITAISTASPDGNFIAFKAAVRGGNSGGPLLNNQGALVGMVIAKANTVAIFQASGMVVKDMAYAISHHTLAQFLADSSVPPSPAGGNNSAHKVDPDRSVFRVICTPQG